jgi:hypothetical protein
MAGHQSPQLPPGATAGAHFSADMAGWRVRAAPPTENRKIRSDGPAAIVKNLVMTDVHSTRARPVAKPCDETGFAELFVTAFTQAIPRASGTCVGARRAVPQPTDRLPIQTIDKVWDASGPTVNVGAIALRSTGAKVACRD